MATVCPITTQYEFTSTLRSLNRAFAQYRLLLRQLGTSTDTAHIRSQMTTIRIRLSNHLYQAKSVIVPTMQSLSDNTAESKELKDWEAKFVTFVQIVESFHEAMLLGVRLLQRSSLASEFLPYQVNTGIADMFNVEKRSLLSLPASLRSSRRSSGGSVSSSSASKQRSEDLHLNKHHLGEIHEGSNSRQSESIAELQREISAVEALLEELHSSCSVAHWSVEHEVDVTAFEDSDEDEAEDMKDGDGNPKAKKTSSPVQDNKYPVNTYSYPESKRGIFRCFVCK